MGLLLLFTAVAAAVWLIALVHHSTAPAWTLALMVLGTFAGPAFYSVAGPVEISADRLLFVAICVATVIRWRMGWGPLGPINRTDAAVVLLTGWLLVSTQSGGEVPGDDAPIGRWLFYVALPAGLYFIIRTIRPTLADATLISGGLIAIALYLAVTAVLEAKGVYSLVFPRYIADPKIFEFLGRGRGPLLNPSGNGIVMTIGLAATIHGVSNQRGRRRVIHLALTAVILAGIGATLTRSGWLAGGLAVGIGLFFYGPRWLRIWSVAATVLIGGLGMMGLKDEILRMKRDKHLTAADAEKSVQLRPLLGIIALEMAADRPIRGHGYGHYFAASKSYITVRRHGVPLEMARSYHQHNVLLSLLVDSGLIGLGLFLGVIGTVTASAWRLAVGRTADPRDSKNRQRIGLIGVVTMAAYLFHGMFQDVQIIPMINMYLFFVAGWVVTVYQKGLTISLGGEIQQNASRCLAG